jgi:tRNA(His) 5'-end guanylyltransferase
MPMHGDHDDFGDRMKAYEAMETARVLDRDVPIYARIDGRSFSSFAHGMRRPFDLRMTAAMVGTMKHLVGETHARIGYTQSDEISLVWSCDSPERQPLFGGKVHKLTSVLASMAAASFASEIRLAFEPEVSERLLAALPHFDCRVFSLPSKTEAANALLWRAMDARKNAVSMATRSVYSAKQMHGKDQSAMRAMLADKGIEFEDYPASFKWGTWARRVTFDRGFTAEELARIPEKHRPPPDSVVARSEVRTIAMPEFHRVSNRVAVVFDGASPLIN